MGAPSIAEGPEAAETLEEAARSHILQQEPRGYPQAVQDMWKEVWRKPQDVPNLRDLWKVRFHTRVDDGTAWPRRELVRGSGPTVSAVSETSDELPAKWRFPCVSRA